MIKKSVLLTALAIAGFAVTSLAQTVPNYVPTNGLVGWWPFNGNAVDESVNTNDGTVNGATLTADRFGNASSAYSFDGNGNFISIPNSNSLSPQNITMNAWFYVAQTYTSGNLCILSKMNHSSASYTGYYMNMDSLTYKKTVGYSIIGCSSGTGVGGYETKKSLFTQKGVWYMLTATISNSGMINLFLNGVLIHQNQGGSFNPCNNSLSELRFGHWWNSDNQWFKGQLDDIGIWNRALTQQEITNLYNGNICYQTITVTLLINTNFTGFNPVTYQNTIKIWPNPTNDHITIDNGNLANLTGHQIKISNALGQQVFQSAITQQQFYVDMSTWGGNGIYFVNLINAQGVTIETRKIVLQ